MFVLEGQYAVEVKANGADLKLNSSHIEYLYVTELWEMALPSFKMRLKDPSTNIFSNIPISDGTPIDIILGVFRGNGALEPWRFQQFGMPRGQGAAGGADSMDLLGLLFKPKYLKGVVDKSYTGFSVDVLKTMATECELKFDSSVTTNDQQVWLPKRDSYYNRMKDVAMRSFVDEKSTAAMCVSVDGTYRYRNLTQLVESDSPTACLHQGVNGGTSHIPNYDVLDYNIRSESSVNNSIMGYNATIGQESMTGTFQREDNISLVKSTNFINVNREVRESTGRVASLYSPPNLGNTHEKFMRSYYQNMRSLLMWSTHVYVLTRSFTDINMLDYVTFYPLHKGAVALNQDYAGNYVVTGRTRALRGNAYYEKLRLTSTGKMADNSNSLM